MTQALILSVLLMLGAPKSVATQVAQSLAMTSLTKQELAFQLAWGRHETNYLERLARNECRPYECDHGLARGAWQLHRGAAGRHWDDLPGNIPLQVATAARATRWALAHCKGDPRGAFRALGGLGCNKPLKGEDARMVTYRTVLTALQENK